MHFHGRFSQTEQDGGQKNAGGSQDQVNRPGKALGERPGRGDIGRIRLPRRKRQTLGLRVELGRQVAFQVVMRRLGRKIAVEQPQRPSARNFSARTQSAEPERRTSAVSFKGGLRKSVTVNFSRPASCSLKLASSGLSGRPPAGSRGHCPTDETDLRTGDAAGLDK